MSISFNEIPQNVLTPFTFVEFDNTNATRNLQGSQPYKILVFGQKLDSGIAETGKLYRVLDEGSAERLFGPSSMLHHIFVNLKRNNRVNEAWAIALPEPGSERLLTITEAAAETEYGLTLTKGSQTETISFSSDNDPTTEEIINGLLGQLRDSEAIGIVTLRDETLKLKLAEDWKAETSGPLSLAEAQDGRATGQIDMKDVATGDGFFSVYIGGLSYQVQVKTGDRASDIAPQLVSEINENPLSFVAAELSGNNDINLTAKQAGAIGLDIPIGFNYNEFDFFPQGLEGAEITPMGSSGRNPDISEVIGSLDEIQFNVIIMPYTDQENLRTLDTFLEDRWGPENPLDGHMFIGSGENPERQIEIAESLNSRQITMLDAGNFPGPAHLFAAAVAGLNSRFASIDPARPQQTLEVRGVLPPKAPKKREVRDQLLKAGVSTTTAQSGKVYIERLVTTYTRNAIGSLDPSYRDLAVKQTLSFLRWDFRRLFASRYPRHKLAMSDERIGPGQAVLTPKSAKAEAVALFRQWELAGLVEDIDQFKTEIVVQISPTDPNRLEFLMTPNLINQHRVIGAQISYIL